MRQGNNLPDAPIWGRRKRYFSYFRDRFACLVTGVCLSLIPRRDTAGSNSRLRRLKSVRFYPNQESAFGPSGADGTFFAEGWLKPGGGSFPQVRNEAEKEPLTGKIGGHISPPP